MQDLTTPTQTDNECKLDFLPLTVKSLSELTPKLRESRAMLCDYTPGGLLFGINNLYAPMICITPEAALISVRSESELAREYMLPIGAGIEAVDILFEHAKKNNSPLILGGIPRNEAEMIARRFHCDYEMTDKLCDYVYDAKALATLEGSSYQTQRTNIRKLEREHESWSYRRLCPENVSDALAFADELFSGATPDGSEFWQAGVEIVYDALANLDALDLVGGILYVDGAVAGIAVGFIKHEMLYIHVLRAKRDIWGAWNLLCREFTADKVHKIKYVNMEDDLENAGIRRMKMSYAPIEFINRCKVRIL